MLLIEVKLHFQEEINFPQKTSAQSVVVPPHLRAAAESGVTHFCIF